VDVADLASGARTIETVAVIGVDAAGRPRGAEVFAPDRLADAIARLYARHAETTDTDRERASGVARATALLIQPPSVERYARAAAPDVVFHDHRTLGLGSGRGVDAFMHGLGTLLALSAETASRVDDVL